MGHGTASCSCNHFTVSPARINEVTTTLLPIAQYGSTRSINAGVAAGIAMHAWIRQHAAG